jgi:hypothetical protein
VTDWRVDLQAASLAELPEVGVQHFARRDRVVVRGVDDEDRRRCAGDGGEESRWPSFPFN